MFNHRLRVKVQELRVSLKNANSVDAAKIRLKLKQAEAELNRYNWQKGKVGGNRV